MKVLVVTNLFGYPWDPSRGVFNQQQFERLARKVELSLLVAVPWTEAIRRPLAYWSARRDGRQRWPYVNYFIFWYLPGLAQGLHALFFFLSLALQRPVTVFVRRWHVMVGSWGFPDAVAVAALGRLMSTPTLMKVHGTDVNDYLRVPGKRWQILTAARWSHAVMAASRGLREQLVSAGVDERHVKVIYNGVDAATFHQIHRQLARERLRLAAGGRLLLFVGNLKFAKGCVDLLEAFIQVAKDQPDLSLRYVGDGEARGHMADRIAEAGLSDRVQLMGKLEHTALPDWFAAASVVCLPSHNEGVPNVLLEAMACGVPVVATSVGGIPEVVPDFAGLLVGPRDVRALAAALVLALRRQWDPTRISAHGSGFTWESNVEQVIDLMRVAAQGAGHAKERQ